MILQGILHLLTGFDHLAFLLVALLGVVRRRDANDAQPLRTAMVESFKVITAFTVAHSITLTLAALGVVALASSSVEASIAATVFITAVAGFWKPTRFHGWPLAAAFGLVHGFGFAGALAGLINGEAAAATSASATAAHSAALATGTAATGPLVIGSFNLGIELAQLAVALALVPLLYLLTRKRTLERWVSPAISAAVAVVALGWFVERIA